MFTSATICVASRSGRTSSRLNWVFEPSPARMILRSSVFRHAAGFERLPAREACCERLVGVTLQPMVQLAQDGGEITAEHRAER